MCVCVFVCIYIYVYVYTHFSIRHLRGFSAKILYFMEEKKYRK